MGKTGMTVICLVVACMVVVASYAEAITYAQVISSLSPCVKYLRKGGAVPTACCTGVKGLYNATKSTPARQSACACIKNLYNSIVGIIFSLGANLPGKCGVNVPYKITPSTDCSKIK